MRPIRCGLLQLPLREAYSASTTAETPWVRTPQPVGLVMLGVPLMVNEAAMSSVQPLKLGLPFNSI